MKTLVCSLVLVGLIVATAGISAVRGEKGKPEFQLHSGYFVSNKVKLKNDSAYLVISDEKVFKENFRSTFIKDKKTVLVPENAFESKLVVAVIKKANAITVYDVTKVNVKKGVLTISYKTKVDDNGGTATYTSPLIVTVDKEKLACVVFMENGKKAATIKLEKEKDKEKDKD